MTDATRRILVLAPMPTELAPVVKRFGLTRGDEGTRHGTLGPNAIVAALAGIGPKAAADNARRLIDAHQPHHVVVVGIAGGLGADVQIGDLLIPAEVSEIGSDTIHRASALGDALPSGRLITSAELIVDKSILQAQADHGIDAVDMETAAVAAVCDEAGLPWTAFRGISDHIRDDLIDSGTMGLLHEDGSPDLAGVARYVARRPANVLKLRRLAMGTRQATTVATTALHNAISAPTRD